MRVLLYLVPAATIQAYALPNPKVVLEGENDITVNDDGSTSIDGETRITTNSASQTINVGGSSGITIGEPAAAASLNFTKGIGKSGGINAESKGNKTSSAGTAKTTGNGGADGLIALIGALQGVSGGGNTAAKSNGTAAAAPAAPAVEAPADIAAPVASE